MDIDFQEILNTVGNWLTTEGLKVVFALIFVFILCKITNVLFRHWNKRLEKRNFDKTLRSVLLPVFRIVVKVAIWAGAIGYLGVETSSISAAIAAVGATIGLALQGSLSNFAGGILVITLRPYKLDDFIEVDGICGTVSEITLFYTYVTTPDNKVAVIPNSKTSNTLLINYTKNKQRRNDILFSISYDEDFEKAKDVIMKVMEKNPYILKKPAPFVNIKEHGDSAIIILARYWANNEHFWDAHWMMMEDVKHAFEKNNISIPYPQLDVHFDKEKEETKKPVKKTTK